MRNIIIVVPVLFFIMISCDDGVKVVDSCGDGFVDPGEQCDGAELNGADCTTAGFYFAPGLACKADCTFDTASCSGRCGDGVLDDAEQCEGNNVGEATCLSRGFSGGTLACDAAACVYDTSGCSGECGNGTIEGDEVCDDGGREPADGCSPGCLVEPGWNCNGVPSHCEAVCGDGLIAGSEACDGANLVGESCETLGFYTGVLACEAGCGAFDTSGCAGRCGDGVADTAEGEACDGGDLAGATCGTQGLAGSGLACNADCTFNDASCTRWVSVACGHSHTCAIDSAGALWCWGDAMSTGQEAVPDEFGRQIVPVPRQVPVSGSVSDVVAGFRHTCVIAGGGLWCWGINIRNESGTGIPDSFINLPTPVVGLSSGVTRVSAGEGHTCAVMSSSLYCWGDNIYGQIGDGTTQNRPQPVNVGVSPADVADVGAGGQHTCAVTVDGALFCWGKNESGQLGVDTPGPLSTPISIAAISELSRVSSGQQSTCGVKIDGSAWCWGANTQGQLGNGQTDSTHEPRQVLTSGSGVSWIAPIRDLHMCHIRLGGTAWCSGFNSWGQLGNGTGGGGTGASRSTPVQVTGLTGVVSIGTGELHSCAVTAAGRLWCWGFNEYGQLGNPAVLLETNVPVLVQAQ